MGGEGREGQHNRGRCDDRPQPRPTRSTLFFLESLASCDLVGPRLISTSLTFPEPLLRGRSIILEQCSRASRLPRLGTAMSARSNGAGRAWARATTSSQIRCSRRTHYFPVDRDSPPQSPWKSRLLPSSRMEFVLGSRSHTLTASGRGTSSQCPS